MPTNPPSVVVPPCPLMPLLPAAPVTLPVADALAMMPALKPTRPPPVPFKPTAMLPAADDWAIVPKFPPTKPPAETLWQELLAAQFGLVCKTLAVDATFVVAEESATFAPGALNPTRPPRPTLMSAPPLTWPLAETLLIIPALMPASMPSHCEVTPEFALTMTLLKLRLRAMPPLPMVPNNPMFCVVESDGAIVTEEMV